MKRNIAVIMRYLCCAGLLLLSFSQVYGRDNSIIPTEINLVSSHKYEPIDVQVAESEQKIIVTGKVRRQLHTHMHIRSTVDVEVLDRNNVVLAEKSIRVANDIDKAGNQTQVPFAVALPKQDSIPYSIKVIIE